MTAFLERLISGEREAILLAAAAYFALMGVLGFIQMIRLKHWPHVVGKLHEEGVERSGVGASSLDDQEYQANVRYSYTVDGVGYTGDRLNPWYVSASHNLRGVLKLQFRGIDRHEGRKVTVYHHPRKPQKAYLDVPGWPSIIGVCSLCIGAAFLIYSAT
jgi:hypothetical protein